MTTNILHATKLRVLVDISYICFLPSNAFLYRKSLTIITVLIFFLLNFYYYYIYFSCKVYAKQFKHAQACGIQSENTLSNERENLPQEHYQCLYNTSICCHIGLYR